MKVTFEDVIFRTLSGLLCAALVGMVDAAYGHRAAILFVAFIFGVAREQILNLIHSKK